METLSMKSAERPTVFISCGQYTSEEKQLGRDIAQLVGDLTNARGYFAENQSSLDGLSRNIMGALNNSAGFIAVMHHRGTVSTPGGDHIRGSVWVEQELAIASFLVQAQDKHMPVAVYIQNGIKREGIRDQLLLGATEFTEPAEVLEDFRGRVESGRFDIASQRAGPLSVTISHRIACCATDRHDYVLDIVVANNRNGTHVIRDYWFELQFPRLLLSQHTMWAVEVRDRASKSHRLFRWTAKDLQKTLYPGDSARGTLDYFINQDLSHTPEILDLPVTVTAAAEGSSPIMAIRTIRELSDF